MASGPLMDAFVTWYAKWNGDVTALPQSLLRPVTQSWHLCSAVSYFNDRNISVQKLFEELCITIGHFTAAQLAADDRSRLYFAHRKSLDPIKKQRKILRAKKMHTKMCRLTRKVLPTPRVHSIKVFALRNMLETC